MQFAIKPIQQPQPTSNFTFGRWPALTAVCAWLRWKLEILRDFGIRPKLKLKIDYNRSRWARLPRAGELLDFCRDDKDGLAFRFRWALVTEDGEFEPGLCRMTLFHLVWPCAANGWRPPVRSVILKQPRSYHEQILINKKSLANYLLSRSEEADRRFSNKGEGN